jgi:hypothetical protein
MPASQQHGFTWENSVLKDVYQIKPGTQKGGYTRQHDVSAEENMLDYVNVSIKTSGTTSVDMGDARRVFQSVSSGESLTLLVLQYSQEDGAEEKEAIKTLRNVLEVDLTGSSELLFAHLTLENITELHEFLKAIPAGKATDAIIAEYKKKAGQLNLFSGAIHMRPKVDSHTQRRLQCSFTNINDFCKKYPTRLLSQSTVGLYKGVQLPLQIASCRRIRHLI